MAIRKFIEEIGEKILPPHRGKSFRNAPPQQQQFAGNTPGQQQSRASTLPEPVLGGELSEASEAIRRHIASRRGFVAPSDLVVLFNEDTPLETILDVRPDILVKGADWVDNIVGSKEVEGWGGKVVALPLVPGQSTTGVIERVLERVQGRGSSR